MSCSVCSPRLFLGLFRIAAADESELLTPPTPLPNVKELVKQYHERGDGKVVVGEYEYKVTHPLTKLGWEARTGLW